MRQSFGKNGQQLGGRVKTAALAARDEAVSAISEAISRAAAKHPPKVMAGLVHMSDEGVRKIRDSERQKHRLESIVSFMQADPTVAAVIERYARLAQEPSLWDYEMQRDFNRDLHRSGRRDG